MSRFPTAKLLGAVVGVIALSSAGIGTALASDQSTVDGTLTSSDGETCSWTDAIASDTPPNTLTIDRTTVNPPGGNLSCSDGSSVTLNNDPTATFDDAAGTVTADLIDVTVVQMGVSCSYRAANVEADRDGDTRRYTASVTASRYSGGFLCPSTAAVDAELTFR